ncbi:MAG: tryptophan-rich sensory protein [Microcoleaceae cyanobacterium]
MTSSSSSLDSNRLRQWLTFISIITAFVVNVASNFTPLNGLTIGEISNTLFSEVKVIPANYAFAIWGLIYLGLFSFAFYQLQTSQRQNPRLKKIGYSLVWASLAQIVWVIVFLNRMFGLSLIAMVVILLSLIQAYLKLKNNSTSVSQKERWFVDTPISIYLGWISVATIVNVASVLYDSGWSGWGVSDSLWTAILIVIAGIIGMILRLKYHETAFLLVLIWAFIAISIRQENQPLIVWSALTISLVLALTGLSTTLTQRYNSSSSTSS